MAWVAAVVAAVGALVQGRQEAAELRAEAEIQGYNAQVQRNAAAQAAQQANTEEERVRRESRQVLGAQRAGIAQSGTGFTGSNIDIMRQDAIAAELDALNVRYEGDVRRKGLLNEAQASEFNKTLLRKKAKGVMRTRWLNAIGAGMSAYGSAGGGFGGGGGGGGGGG